MGSDIVTSFRVNRELWRWVKIYAMETGLTIKSLLETLLRMELEEQRVKKLLSELTKLTESIKPIEEALSHPELDKAEVKAKEELFKNWYSHYVMAYGIQNAFCPSCGKEKSGELVWSCCGLSAEEALKVAGDKLMESTKKTPSS